LKLKDKIVFEGVVNESVTIKLINLQNNNEILGTNALNLQEIKNLKSTSSIKLNNKDGNLIGDIFLKAKVD
jgi:hypothetical protein